jgi:hypothetical protein
MREIELMIGVVRDLRVVRIKELSIKVGLIMGRIKG